jgi:hypothetical protein
MERDRVRNSGTVPVGMAEAFVLVRRRDFACVHAQRLTIRSFVDGPLWNRPRYEIPRTRTIASCLSSFIGTGVNR